MASPVIAPKSPSPRPEGPSTALRIRSEPRWPGSGAGRQLARLLFSLPWVGFAILGADTLPAGDANSTLAARGSLIVWGATDLGWVSQIWPPVPVGIAGLTGGSLLALAIVASVAAGGLVHTLVERMVLQGTPWWLTGLAVVAVTGTPMMGYLVATDLAQFLSLVFVAMALNSFLRFAVFGRTEGGFQAGLLLALAVACDVSAVLFALTMAAAAPMIARYRYRGRPGSGRATALVLGFPAVAVLAAWAFLEWRFTGSALSVIRSSGAFSFPGGVWVSLGDALDRVGRGIALAPIYLFCGVLLFSRSPKAVLGYLMPLPALVLGLWWGLRPVSGLTLILISCLALFAIPSDLSRRLRWVAAAALIVQIGVTWTIGVALLPQVDAWWTALWTSSG